MPVSRSRQVRFTGTKKPKTKKLFFWFCVCLFSFVFLVFSVFSGFSVFSVFSGFYSESDSTADTSSASVSMVSSAVNRPTKSPAFSLSSSYSYTFPVLTM